MPDGVRAVVNGIQRVVVASVMRIEVVAGAGGRRGSVSSEGAEVGDTGKSEEV